MIIGLAGTLGSGKGTVTEYLKTKGFTHYSSSQTLGEILDAEGLPKTRDNYSPLATRLQQEFSGGIVEKNYLEKFLTEKPEHAVFEAIHRKTEADFIRSVGGFIIGVDADIETRYNRTVLRNEGEKDQKSFDDFKKQSHIEDDGGGDALRDNNIRSVLESADVVVSNAASLEELFAEVDKALLRFTK